MIEINIVSISWGILIGVATLIGFIITILMADRKSMKLKERYDKTWIVDDINLTTCNGPNHIVDAYLELTGSETIEHFDEEFVYLASEEFIKKITEFGMWAFADKTEPRIYIWYNKSKVDDAKLLHLIAHEVGHLHGPDYNSPEQDEDKAIEFADVTSIAFEFLDTLKQEGE